MSKSNIIAVLTAIKILDLYKVGKAVNGGTLGFDEGRDPRGRKGELVKWLAATYPESALLAAVATVTGSAPAPEPAPEPVVEPAPSEPAPEPGPVLSAEPAPIGIPVVDAAAEAHRILGLPFNQIHGAIGDLVERANRPPEIIETVVEKVVREFVDRPVDRIVYADRAAKVDAATGRLAPQSLGLKPCAEVFGVAVPRADGSDTMVEVFDCATDAPDAHYRWNVETLRLFLSALKHGRWSWLYGPPGTGKTEFLRNVAARLGRPFFRISFDGALERYELIGGERLRKGDTQWLEGILTVAITTPHAIVDLDEVSFGRPEHLSSMHAVLEPNGSISIPETGKVIPRAEGCYIAATDNTNGGGDLSGAFTGTRPMNRAFINRYGMFLRFDYLDPVTEAKLISDRTGINVEAARIIADFAARARVAVASGDLAEAPSLRVIVPLAETLLDGVSLPDAFDAVVANRMDPASAEALRQIANTTIDRAALAAAIVK